MTSREREYVSINLNTKFANNFGRSGYLTEPVWYLPEAIDKISAVKLKNFTCPLSVYTIDGRNNKLTLIQSDSTSNNRVVTLPSSNYTGLSLATQLTTLLNSAGTYTYSVDYNTSGTNTIFISATGGTFAFADTANNAYIELGLNNLLADYSASKTSETLDLSGVSQIHLVSNVAGTSVVNQNYKILATITTEESPLDVSYYQDDSNDYINSNIPSLSEVTVRLYDNQFRRITPTKDYSMTINFVREAA